MTNAKKIKTKLGIFFMLTAIMIVTTQYAAAKTTRTSLTVRDNSKTTSEVGPTAHAKFSINILQDKGGYEAQLKDPYLWHTRRSDSGLKKGAKASFTRTEGSSKAYWRGWIKNGSITITAV